MAMITLLRTKPHMPLIGSPNMLLELFFAMLTRYYSPILLMLNSMLRTCQNFKVIKKVVNFYSVFMVKFSSIWMKFTNCKPIYNMCPKRIPLVISSWIIRSIYSKPTFIIKVAIVPVFRHPHLMFSNKSSISVLHLIYSYKYILPLKGLSHA